MYDVEKLEKEWENYKSKQRSPWIIATAFFLLILLLIIFREDFLKILPKQASEQNSSLKSHVSTLLPENDLNLTAEKSLISNDTQEINGSVEKVKTTPLMSIEVSDQEVESREKKRKYLKIEVTERYPTKKKEGSKKSSKNSNERTIKDVERSFIKSGEYRDALYLARAYYKQGDYDKAQKWALVTNDLNSNMEESWLIFAKSKAQNGQNREAEQVLTAYIDKTDSAKAKVLLIKIRKGKF